MALFNFGKTTPQPLSAPPVAPKVTAPATGGLVPMEDLLRLVVDEGGSDLHISVGAPPAIRLHGHLVKLQLPVLTPENTDTLARAITSDTNLQKVNTEGSVDFGLSFRGDNRFRCSVYRQRGAIAMVLRLIPKRLLTLDEIGFPGSIRELLT